MQVFEIKSGELIISDPCYRDPSFSQARLNNIRKGKWLCEELKTDNRCFLHIIHRDIAGGAKLHWEEVDGDLMSESGMLGIFDIFEFKPRDDSWFRRCCELTESGTPGVLPKGCVTLTALKAFEFYLARHPAAKDVVAVKVSLT